MLIFLPSQEKNHVSKFSAGGTAFSNDTFCAPLRLPLGSVPECVRVGLRGDVRGGGARAHAVAVQAGPAQGFAGGGDPGGGVYVSSRPLWERNPTKT